MFDVSCTFTHYFKDNVRVLSPDDSKEAVSQMQVGKGLDVQSGKPAGNGIEEDRQAIQ